MKEFLFLRHGETDWAVQRFYYGYADCQLNERGRRQAVEAGERLREFGPFQHAFVSDLSRTRDTASLAFPEIRDWVQLPELRERNFGRWEGRHYREIMESEPEEWQAWCEDTWTRPVPGGESDSQFGRRAAGAWQRLEAAVEEGERALVVAHSGSIRGMLIAALDLPSDTFQKLRLDPRRACRLLVSEGYPVLVGFGI